MAPQYAKDQPQGFANHISRVAMTGAGGRLGKEIALSLLKTGKHTVTALTRADSTSSLPDGVKAIVIDYSDESSIASALKDIDFLIITLATMVARGTATKLIRAAASAGVKYVMPNSYGPDNANDDLMEKSFLAPGHREQLAEIQAKGLHSIVLCCSFWYEWSLACGPGAYGFDIPNRSVTFFDDGEAKVNTSTWVQCGRAVAALLSLKLLPEDESDEELTLSRFFDGIAYVSSFRVSQRDMLESLKRATGTKEEEWTITREDSKERWQKGVEAMQKGDRMGFVRAMYARVFEPNGGGDIETTKGLHNELLGLPTEDLDEATREAVRMVQNHELPYFP